MLHVRPAAGRRRTDAAAESAPAGVGPRLIALGRSRAFALSILATVFGLLTLWTWQAWADPIIDFGREAYVPWRLISGAVLYRDVVHLGGPLSPYWNAMLFTALGANLLTLALGNLVVLALITFLVHDLVRRAAGSGAALAAGIVLLTVFAFGQLLRIANYNYVMPYAHELTHGLVLSLVLLRLLVEARRRSGSGWPIAAGATLGLVFLTKPEVFVAAAGATLTWLLAGVVLGGGPTRNARTAGHVATGFVLGLAAAFLLLLPAMHGNALGGLFGGWTALMRVDAAAMPFYRRGMGIDTPAANIGEMLAWVLRGAAVLGPAVMLAIVPRWRRAASLVAAATVFVTLAAWLCGRPVNLLPAARTLPVVVLVAGVAALIALGRAREAPDRETSERHLLQLTATVFAGLLLLKMILFTRVFHYGFVLAMPATMVLVTVLVASGPALVERRGGAGVILRAAGLAVLLGAVATSLRTMSAVLAAKTAPVGEGADAVRTFEGDRGTHLGRLVRDLGGMVRAGQTLAVLPEGVMVNFMTGRVNPTPYVTLMPLEVTAFGEGHIVEAFEAAPPDYIALVHKDTSEYGVRFFGRDYAQSLLAWIAREYVPVAGLGAEPFVDGRFGIVLLRRRDASETIE